MWLLPSRGRVENAVRLAELAPDAPILLWVSADDPRAGEYTSVQWPAAWDLTVGMAGLRLAGILREFYRKHPDLPYYGFIGDDVVPSPDTWHGDLAVAAADRFVAYPEDSHWGEKLCPHFCIGGDLVRAVGWFAAPKLLHSFIDTAWFVIAMTTRLQKFVPSVKFDHRHPITGAAEHDATYARGQETFAYDRDVFQRWRGTGLDEAVRRIGKSGLLPRNSPDSVLAFTYPRDMRALMQ